VTIIAIVDVGHPLSWEDWAIFSVSWPNNMYKAAQDLLSRSCFLQILCYIRQPSNLKGRKLEGRHVKASPTFWVGICLILCLEYLYVHDSLSLLLAACIYRQQNQTGTKIK
jgi:hypothetical protein